MASTRARYGWANRPTIPSLAPSFRSTPRPCLTRLWSQAHACGLPVAVALASIPSPIARSRRQSSMSAPVASIINQRSSLRTLTPLPLRATPLAWSVRPLPCPRCCASISRLLGRQQSIRPDAPKYVFISPDDLRTSPPISSRFTMATPPRRRIAPYSRSIMFCPPRHRPQQRHTLFRPRTPPRRRGR